MEDLQNSIFQLLIAEVLRSGQRSDKDLSKAIFKKTCKEVKAGTMGCPKTHKQLAGHYGPGYNVVPSFGIEQGEDSAGRRKFRSIDKHTKSGCNPAAERRQKVPMAMVGHILLMFTSVASALQLAAVGKATKCTAATEDMKAASQQVPLLASHMQVASRLFKTL